ncbi:MAG: tRNA lysidine(34) synthetase TilS [Bacteroidia bacterium]
MDKEFVSYINQDNLFSATDSILVTVSGGLDSIVMCELFHKANLNFSIAHCNFQLRKEESDEDELFVKQLAFNYDVPIHIIKFNTSTYSKKNKVSIQVAARELRYQWFEEIRLKHNYSYIATAHHQNDAIETFFINLMRGSGISGLRSILSKHDCIIRPLLFASKQQIINYAKKNKLVYREDSSNASDKYLRNQIRHQVIPLLNELSPSFENAIIQTLANLRATELIYLAVIEKIKSTHIIEDENGIRIPIKKLKKLSPLDTYLYELLKSYNFNSTVVQKISTSLDANSGKLFYSATHRLVKDRDFLIIEPFTKLGIKQNKYLINKEQSSLPELHLLFNLVKNTAAVSIPKSPQQASLDYDKLIFPLEVRRWKAGDRFRPLGMKGEKKLSDFFINKKLSIAEKENTWVLCSAKKIVWVMGFRIDDDYKITPTTNKIYFVEIENTAS